MLFALASYAAFLFKGTLGIEKDLTKAIGLCKEAADLGNQSAICNLPMMIAEATEIPTVIQLE